MLTGTLSSFFGTLACNLSIKAKRISTVSRLAHFEIFILRSCIRVIYNIFFVGLIPENTRLQPLLCFNALSLTGVDAKNIENILIMK